MDSQTLFSLFRIILLYSHNTYASFTLEVGLYAISSWIDAY